MSYHVFSKNKVVDQVHHTVGVLWVLVSQKSEDLDLDQGLFVEPALVPDDLQGQFLLVAVVVHAQHLAEAALAEDLQDLVSVADVVAGYHLVVAAFVVVAVVRGVHVVLHLFGTQTDVVDLGVAQDLVLLVGRELRGEEFQNRGRRGRHLYRLP